MGNVIRYPKSKIRPKKTVRGEDTISHAINTQGLYDRRRLVACGPTCHQSVKGGSPSQDFRVHYYPSEPSNFSTGSFNQDFIRDTFYPEKNKAIYSCYFEWLLVVDTIKGWSPDEILDHPVVGDLNVDIKLKQPQEGQDWDNANEIGASSSTPEVSWYVIGGDNQFSIHGDLVGRDEPISDWTYQQSQYAPRDRALMTRTQQLVELDSGIVELDDPIGLDVNVSASDNESLYDWPSNIAQNTDPLWTILAGYSIWESTNHE